MNYLQLASFGIDYGKHLYKQYRFIKHWLEPLAFSIADTLKYKLDKHEKRKMFRYYPILSVCAIAENYVYLRGRALTETERKRISLMSSMATLCDDLIDEDGWTEQQLLDLLDSKLAYSTLSLKAKLIVAMNEEFKKLDIKPGYWDQLRKAFHGQAESVRQHKADLSLEETLAIAREKNGNYCLTVAALIDEDWTSTEKQIIYQHGIMGQMANDIFDAWKDTKQGVFTMIKKVSSMQQLRELFLAECSKMQQLILTTDAPLKRKRKMTDRYAVMDAFTLVGIDNLIAVEKKYGQPIPWESIPRKELVTDMEYFSNKMKYLKYIFWLSNFSQKTQNTLK
jgi:hypothetical protein